MAGQLELFEGNLNPLRLFPVQDLQPASWTAQRGGLRGQRRCLDLQEASAHHGSCQQRVLHDVNHVLVITLVQAVLFYNRNGEIETDPLNTK